MDRAGRVADVAMTTWTVKTNGKFGNTGDNNGGHVESHANAGRSIARRARVWREQLMLFCWSCW